MPRCSDGPKPVMSGRMVTKASPSVLVTQDTSLSVAGECFDGPVAARPTQLDGGRLDAALELVAGFHNVLTELGRQ